MKDQNALWIAALTSGLMACGGQDAPEGADAAVEGLPAAGTYEIGADSQTQSPAGCRPGDSEGEQWRFAIDPRPEGYTLYETYAEGPDARSFMNEYECVMEGEVSRCTNHVGQDYNQFGMDALVSLATTYEFAAVDRSAIVGEASFDIDCTGDACGQVTDHWRVSGFPCDIDSSFTGTLQ